MRLLHVLILVAGCATTSKYSYEELESCPTFMNEQQHLSGVVRCRALCSSYARDFAEYGDDCRCWCAPPPGVRKPSQQPQRHRAPFEQTSL